MTFDKNRTWIEPPRDVNGWNLVVEFIRQRHNRDNEPEQVESPTYYMQHLWNFYPRHMTFAYADEPKAQRAACRFYTWRW